MIKTLSTRHARIRVRAATLFALTTAFSAAGPLADSALAQETPAAVTCGATVEGITEYTLDNGLRVLLLLRRGTASHSRQEIEDELDRLKAQVSSGGSARVTTASVTTVRQSLPAVLELVGEMLREPSFDLEEFELLKEERARLEAATVDEARGFWESHYGAQAGTMAIVGDFDPAEIRPLLAEIFGSWSARIAYERYERPFPLVEPSEIEIETPDKANAVMVAGLNLELRDDHQDYPALLLGNYILGGGFLSSRLATRIRRDEGLSYSVGSNIEPHPVDERGQFLAFAQNLRGRDQGIASQLAAGLYFDRTMEWTAELERKISGLTTQQINDALRRHIEPSRMVIIRVGDFAKFRVTS